MGDRRWTESRFYALKDILGVVMSNDDHTIQDLHDTLKPYYKVARKRFVDAVCLQAVDHFLVSGEASLLWIISPNFIGNMSDSELNQIAGDEDETFKRRNMLETELTSLRAGDNSGNLSFGFLSIVLYIPLTSGCHQSHERSCMDRSLSPALD
jgi:hypothetical protein